MKIVRKKSIVLITISIIVILVICIIYNFLPTKTSTKVKIGIIDSYISEELLNNKNIENVNYTNLNTDIINNNHGLVTLQIISDECTDSYIYYASVLDENNTGEIESVISAIEWCIEQDVDVICMSFATTINNTMLEDAIYKAIENNITIVSSCINFSDIDCYPAMYKGVVSVSEGANKNANVILLNRTFSVVINNEKLSIKGTSALTAYVSGYISEEFYKGNTDIGEIVDKIK